MYRLTPSASASKMSFTKKRQQSHFVLDDASKVRERRVRRWLVVSEWERLSQNSVLQLVQSSPTALRQRFLPIFNAGQIM
jgi:hypothetical protein